MKKDDLDRLTILQKAELVKARAEEIEKNNETLSKLKAYDLAKQEILKANGY